MTMKPQRPPAETVPCDTLELNLDCIGHVLLIAEQCAVTIEAVANAIGVADPVVADNSVTLLSKLSALAAVVSRASNDIRAELARQPDISALLDPRFPSHRNALKPLLDGTSATLSAAELLVTLTGKRTGGACQLQ
ncbi:hypothetical protein LA345_40670 (plasmid) [Burkholderia vietnamiensis]|uniref:Uncharacterized protein n=1 Tax=Burkholderia vietnamiensis (strain G4 / LMG 22486) TaxID=269482 RepID=A4JTX8_BURVG|nr:hypothetical protein Bcep1808_6844 [Burkholderia vietnamiensis G4]MCB4350110.1 hypothetical protein [Burkholderia vietnamiensis]